MSKEQPEKAPTKIIDPEAFLDKLDAIYKANNRNDYAPNEPYQERKRMLDRLKQINDLPDLDLKSRYFVSTIEDIKEFIQVMDDFKNKEEAFDQLTKAIKESLTPEGRKLSAPIIQSPEKASQQIQLLVDAYINTDESKPKVIIQQQVKSLIHELNNHSNNFKEGFQKINDKLEKDLGKDVAKLAMDVLDAWVTNVAIREEHGMIKHTGVRDIALAHIKQARANLAESEKAQAEAKAQAEKAIEEAEKLQAEKIAAAQQKLVENLESIKFSDDKNLRDTIGEKNAKHFIESREELRNTLQDYKNTKDIKKLGNFDEKVSTLQKWCAKEIEKNKTKEGVKGFFQKVGDLIKGYDREKAQTQLVGMKTELETIKAKVKDHTSDFDKASNPAPKVKSTSSGRSV